MQRCSRAVIAALLAGCGTDNTSGGDDALAPPASCDVLQLAYNHDLALPAATSGAVTVGGHAFGNAQTTKPGELILYKDGSVQGTPPVHLYFAELVLDGHIVPARGAIVLPDQGIEVANCDGDPYSGWLSVVGNGVYKFGITSLHEGADCSGPAITGSFAGCYQEQPF
jgi:hypothetical protein